MEQAHDRRMDTCMQYNDISKFSRTYRLRYERIMYYYYYVRYVRPVSLGKSATETKVFPIKFY